MSVVLEAEISPGMNTAAAVRLAELVEEAGFARLGISDVVFWPDSFMVQALCAQATRLIAVGAMVTNPYTRHPVVLAGASGSLDRRPSTGFLRMSDSERVVSLVPQRSVNVG